MEIGIDSINFYVPNYFIDMVELAKIRNIEIDKVLIGLGQEKMSILPDDQDIITLAANAAYPLIDEKLKEEIDMIIVATESALDFSKSISVSIHELLEIQNFARCFEVKQACYSSTAGLNIAKNHIQNNPEKKVLLIACDIAKYDLNTPGELTQGSGAVAMIISQNPKILKINDDSVFYTKNTNDFFRPYYSEFPVVDGTLSTKSYLDFFNILWTHYTKKEKASLFDFSSICFHIPYTKMGLKSLNSIINEVDLKKKEKLLSNFDSSIQYNKQIGNIYTASLYLSILSLLDNSNNLVSGDKIGIYSYGSGSVAEFLSLSLVDNYDKYLSKDKNNKSIANRKKISLEEYENFYLKNQESNIKDNKFSDNTIFYLSSIENHIRKYKKTSPSI